MEGYVSITPNEIPDNIFKLIGSDYMLVTPQKEDGSFNTMTASWGGAGVLWNFPVCFVFIRPQRYTYEFSEAGELAALSFFGSGQRKALAVCGTKSGRDTDKIKEAGLTPVKTDCGTVAFAEAELIISCRKLYADDLKEICFTDEKVKADCYPESDYHRVYVYKIEAVYRRA